MCANIGGWNINPIKLNYSLAIPKIDMTYKHKHKVKVTYQQERLQTRLM